MKTITIGRGPENQVTLDDPKISRRHALLRCYPLGKMEIVDLSQNGTFVNGMQIANNKPYPLTRKDIVIFAHAEKLDWKQVPSPYRRIRNLILLTVTLVVAIIVCLYYFTKIDTSRTGIENAPQYVGPTIPSPKSNATENVKVEENKSDNRFVFPQHKKGNPKGTDKQKEAPKTNKQEKTEPSKKEEFQEQSVL
jgi:hypothetical protein